MKKYSPDFITIGGIYSIYKWGEITNHWPTKNISKDSKMGYEYNYVTTDL